MEINRCELDIYDKDDIRILSYNLDNAKDINKYLKTVDYFFENYDKLSNKEYFDIIKMFYDIYFLDSDYLEIIKRKTGKKFDRIIDINTDIMYFYNKKMYRSEYKNIINRLILRVAVSNNFIKDNNFEVVDNEVLIGNKSYTIDEVDELIQDGKVYLVSKYLDRYYENLPNILNEDVDKRLVPLVYRNNYIYNNGYNDLIYLGIGSISEDNLNIVADMIKEKIPLNKVYRDIKSYFLKLVKLFTRFGIYYDKDYLEFNKVSKETYMSEVIAIEKLLYYYDKHFKNKFKLEDSGLYKEEVMVKF